MNIASAPGIEETARREYRAALILPRQFPILQADRPSPHAGDRPTCHQSLVAQSGKPIHLPGVERVDRADDTQLPRLDEFRQDRLGSAELFHDMHDVVADGVLNAIAGLVRGLIHGRTQRRHETRQLARQRAAFHRRGHGTAVLVSHDDDQRHVQMFGRVLDAGGLVVARNVAGDADREDVAQPLVEDDLGRYARIGARQDRAMRSLTGGQQMLTIRGLMWMQILLGGVMRIASLELGERRVGGWQ